MTTPADRARRLRELHTRPPLVLPNAWDAGSARAIEAAGATAIATNTSSGTPFTAVATTTMSQSAPVHGSSGNRSRSGEFHTR